MTDLVREYARHRPGEPAVRPEPGDVVLIHSPTVVGKGIRWFQRLRYRDPSRRGYAHWSHVALVLDSDGRIAETGRAGVIGTRLERYRGVEYHLVGLRLSQAARVNAVHFAYSSLRQRYGLAGFLLLGLSLSLGGRLPVPDYGQQGCAAFVVRALQTAGLTFARGPAEMTPADLAEQFGVRP